MDPELRAYLDAMRQETNERFDALGQETNGRFDALGQESNGRFDTLGHETGQQMVAMEQRAIVRDAETRAETHQRIEAARSEARVLHEATMTAIGTVIEGLDMLRSSVERRAEDRERATLDRHIAPLEASTANHERRIKALEERAAGQ